MLQPQSSLAFRGIFRNEKFCDLQPLPLSAIGAQRAFRVNVIFKSPTHTLHALNTACALAQDPNTEDALLLPGTVPEPPPSGEPDGPRRCLCRRSRQSPAPLSRHPNLAAYVHVGGDLVERLS